MSTEKEEHVEKGSNMDKAPFQALLEYLKPQFEAQENSKLFTGGEYIKLYRALEGNMSEEMNEIDRCNRWLDLLYDWRYRIETECDDFGSAVIAKVLITFLTLYPPLALDEFEALFKSQLSRVEPKSFSIFETDNNWLFSDFMVMTDLICIGVRAVEERIVKIGKSTPEKIERKEKEARQFSDLVDKGLVTLHNKLKDLKKNSFIVGKEIKDFELALSIIVRDTQNAMNALKQYRSPSGLPKAIKTRNLLQILLPSETYNKTEFEEYLKFVDQVILKRRNSLSNDDEMNKALWREILDHGVQVSSTEEDALKNILSLDNIQSEFGKLFIAYFLDKQLSRAKTSQAFKKFMDGLFRVLRHVDEGYFEEAVRSTLPQVAQKLLPEQRLIFLQSIVKLLNKRKKQGDTSKKILILSDIVSEVASAEHTRCTHAISDVMTNDEELRDLRNGHSPRRQRLDTLEKRLKGWDEISTTKLKLPEKLEVEKLVGEYKIQIHQVFVIFSENMTVENFNRWVNKAERSLEAAKNAVKAFNDAGEEVIKKVENKIDAIVKENEKRYGEVIKKHEPFLQKYSRKFFEIDNYILESEKEKKNKHPLFDTRYSFLEGETKLLSTITKEMDESLKALAKACDEGKEDQKNRKNVFWEIFLKIQASLNDKTLPLVDQLALIKKFENQLKVMEDSYNRHLEIITQKQEEVRRAFAREIDWIKEADAQVKRIEEQYETSRQEYTDTLSQAESRMKSAEEELERYVSWQESFNSNLGEMTDNVFEGCKQTIKEQVEVLHTFITKNNQLIEENKNKFETKEEEVKLRLGAALTEQALGATEFFHQAKLINTSLKESFDTCQPLEAAKKVLKEQITVALAECDTQIEARKQEKNQLSQEIAKKREEIKKLEQTINENNNPLAVHLQKAFFKRYIERVPEKLEVADLLNRQKVVDEVEELASEDKSTAQAQLVNDFKSMDLLATAMLLRIKEDIVQQGKLKVNAVKETVATIALFLFDNKLFSWLPFVASSKQLIADQQALEVRIKTLTQIESRINQVVQVVQKDSVNVQENEFIKASTDLCGVDIDVLENQALKMSVDALTVHLGRGYAHYVLSREAEEMVNQAKVEQNRLTGLAAQMKVMKDEYDSKQQLLDKIDDKIEKLGAVKGALAKLSYEMLLSYYQEEVNTKQILPLDLILGKEPLIETQMQLLSDLIIKNPACVNLPFLTHKRNFTPLHLAVEKGRLDIVELLLKNGAFSDSPGKKNLTPLDIAACKNNSEIVETLLDPFFMKMKFPDLPPLVNRKNRYGNSPLHYAAGHADAPSLKYLSRQKDVKMNIQNVDGNTPLHLAVKAGSYEAIKFLILDPRVKLNILNNKGEEAFGDEEKNGFLHQACQRGDVEFVEQLLKHGADVNEIYRSGNGIQGYGLLFQVSLSYSLTHEDPIKQAKFKAILDLLLKKVNFVAEDTDNEGNNALHLAAKSGYVPLIAELATRTRPDVFDKTNKDGDTALHLAIQNNQRAIVDQIIQYSNGNLPNNKGNTPLHLMVMAGEKYDSGTLNHLMRHTSSKAKVLNSVNKDGNTPLHLAIEGRNVAALQWLLARKAVNITLQNSEKKAPFETEEGKKLIADVALDQNLPIVQREHEKLCQLLIEKGVVAKEALKSAPEILLPQNHELPVRLAEPVFAPIPAANEKEAESPPVNDEKKIFNWYSLDNRKKGVEDAIENAEYRLDTKHENDNTLLHLVAIKGDLDMAKIIKAQFPAPEPEKQNPWADLLCMPNENGETPLHIAIKDKKLLLLDFFLEEKGAHFIDQIAWKMAIDSGDARVVGLMLQKNVPMFPLIKTEMGKINFYQNSEIRDFWVQVVQTESLNRQSLLKLLKLEDKNHNQLGHALFRKAVDDKKLEGITKLIESNQYDEAVINALTSGTDFETDTKFKAFWIDYVEKAPQDKKSLLINAKDKNGNTLLHIAVMKGNYGAYDKAQPEKDEVPPGSVTWCFNNGAVATTAFESLDKLAFFVNQLNELNKCKGSKEKLTDFLRGFLATGILKLDDDAQQAILQECLNCLSEEIPEASLSAVKGVLISRCGFDVTPKNHKDQSVLSVAYKGWKSEQDRWLAFNKDYGKLGIYVWLTSRVVEILKETLKLQSDLQKEMKPLEEKKKVYQLEDGDTELHKLIKSRLLNEMYWSGTFWGNLPSMLNTVNTKGRTPLYTAVLMKDLDQVKFLLSKGADVNITDKNGNTVLHWLVTRNNQDNSVVLEMFKEVLKQPNVNVNVVDANGETVLHLLAKRNEDETGKVDEIARAMVDEIKSKDNNTHIKNKAGHTPALVAWAADNKDFLKYFPLSRAEDLWVKAAVKAAGFKRAVNEWFFPSKEPEENKEDEDQSKIYPPVFKAQGKEQENSATPAPEAQAGVPKNNESPKLGPQH